MRPEHFGDSYDIVKRFWAESLRVIAPLYAHPRFIPADIQSKFLEVTTIPILDLASPPQKPFGLLLDPDTGIPFPTKLPKSARSHATLPFIAEVMGKLQPRYLIAFDQSLERRREFTGADQRREKMNFLSAHGFPCFYYVAHAPFLFVARTQEGLAEVRKLLVSLGIPEYRFTP